MKKKSEKVWALLLTAVMVFTLTACGRQKETAVEPGGSGANEVISEEKSEAAAKVTGEALKVVLLITSNLGDKAFYDSADGGMKLIAEELGAEVKTIEMGQDPSKYEPYFRDVAEQDWDYIIVGSSPAVEIAEMLIPEYPDKKFIMFDTEVDWSKGDFSNLYCVQYKQNEGSFLAGAVAAIMTTQGKNANPDKVIGCIGGSDLPIINDFMIGYIRGAQQVEPDIKVAVSYAGTFVDSTKGKELALSQMNQQKVDICFQIASQTGIGVLDAAKELGLYAIGVDGDQAAAFQDSDPEMADVIVTSMMKLVDQSLLRAIKLAEEGTLPWGSTEAIGLKEQGVGIIYGANFERELSAENQALIKDLEQKIIAGEITVDSAIGMDTAEFEVIRNELAP